MSGRLATKFATSFRLDVHHILRNRLHMHIHTSTLTLHVKYSRQKNVCCPRMDCLLGADNLTPCARMVFRPLSFLLTIVMFGYKREKRGRGRKQNPKMCEIRNARLPFSTAQYFLRKTQTNSMIQVYFQRREKEARNQDYQNLVRRNKMERFNNNICLENRSR